MSHSVNPRIDLVRDQGFPTVKQLRDGIVLSCIMHSFWLVVHDPVFEIFWHEDTYFEDQIQGEHFATAFDDCGAVAVFYSSESDRNPFPMGSPSYNQGGYFDGMPSRLNAAKERALSLMYDTEYRRGNPNMAVITSAMWANVDVFSAIEPWCDVFDNSGWACDTHLLPPEVALREWWNGLGLPGSGEDVAWSLYRRRLESNERNMTIEKSEWEAYLEAAGNELSPERVSATEYLLNTVGILLPPNVLAK